MWCCTNYSLLSDGNYWDRHKMSVLMEITESKKKKMTDEQQGPTRFPGGALCFDCTTV